MTALKPIENRRVRGVASERYPLNAISSHPESTDEATDPHHCFPRSQQIGDSWFIEITFDTVEEALNTLGQDAVLWRRHPVPGAALEKPRADFKGEVLAIIPHVTGLTAEEHRRVEVHEAKITLEDGVWIWYDRSEYFNTDDPDDLRGAEGGDGAWVKIGPLNPQPGSREGKTKKRKKQASTTAEKKDRVNYTVRVPKDEENLLPEMEETLRDEFKGDMGWKDDVPAYFVWMAAAAKALQR